MRGRSKKVIKRLSLPTFKVGKVPIVLLTIVFTSLFIAFTNTVFNIPLVRAFYSVLFVVLLWLLVLLLVVVVWRKQGINIVFYKPHVWMLVLFTLFIINALMSVVYRQSTSFIDAFVFIPYLLMGLVVAFLIVWVFSFVVYSLSYSLNRVFRYIPFVVLGVDLIGVALYFLIKADIVNVSFVGDTLRQLFLSRSFPVVVWGDVGTFVLFHVFGALIVLLTSAQHISEKDYVKGTLEGLIYLVLMGTLLYGVFLLPLAGIFMAFLTLTLVAVLVLSSDIRECWKQVAIFILSVFVLGVPIYSFASPERYLEGMKELLVQAPRNTLVVFAEWFTNYGFLYSLFGNLLNSSVLTYLFGLGAFHSGLFLPILALRRGITTSYLPIVNYIAEFGVLPILVGLIVTGYIAYLWIKHPNRENILAKLLVVISAVFLIFFYPSLFGWALIGLVAMLFFETYAVEYKGFLRLGVYGVSLKNKMQNYTHWFFLLIAFVIVSVLGYQSYKLAKSLYYATSVLYSQQQVSTINSVQDFKDKKEEINILLRRLNTLKYACGNCVLYYVVKTDTLTSILNTYQKLAQDNKDEVEKLGLPLNEYLYQLQVGVGYLTEGLSSANLLRIGAEGYATVYRLTNSRFFLEKAVDLYGRYMSFAPQDITSSREYARLLIDIVDENNVSQYEGRFAAVMNLLELAAVEQVKANNIGLLLDVVTLKGSFLVKVKRYEEAKRLYQRFLQIVDNLQVSSEVKQQLKKNVNQILSQLDELSSGTEEEKQAENQSL